MENPSSDHADSDICKCGYLRKQKSMHRRFFVLRAASERGPCRLEYYENEKKFRCRGAFPKRSLNLETCLSISKRADLRNKHLIVIYTKEDSFVLGVEGAVEQQSWYQAMVDLQCKSKSHAENGEYGVASPGPAFKEVWQVSLRPKGLGQAKNLVGIYRLCLTDKTINFVRLNSDAAAVVLQLMNIRRCGHSENYFFIEMGRSAVTGPGEFWMQVEDSVVAQNMHETILEAMKAMSEEVRLRSKSQSLSSNPISVPSRRHHANPPPSQVGFPRRSRTETVSNTSPTPKHNFHRARTSSDGNGSACRPKSQEGSPARSTPTLKQKSQKSQGGPKLHPPLNHTKSTPVPSVRSPTVPSPVSLSSSSTSGHGSDCMYTRASSSSISESPSDYCFTSSDEYGSSPGDSRHSCTGRSVTPDPVSYMPPSLDDSNMNYIAMGKLGSLAEEGQCQRRVLRRASSREGEIDRGLSKRASLPPMALGKLTPSLPRRRREEYTVMSRTASRESFTAPSRGAAPPYTEGIDVPNGSQRESGKNDAVMDNGYMAMLPGVAPTQSKNDDYMPMTPNSVSPPQQINSRLETNGYMVMSPNGSCSPDNAAYRRSWVSAEKLSVGSSDSKMSGSDYMNMSPLSRSASSTPPDSGIHLPEEAPKMVYAYYSLPRSYKQAVAKFKDSPFNPSMSTGRLSYSSSSASSDSLGDQESSHFSACPVSVQVEDQPQKTGKGKLPVSLFIDISKASTLPRVRETPLPPEPKSPGEYVSIEFRGSSGSSRPSIRPASCIGDFHEMSEASMSSEYVTMDLGPPANFSQYAETPLAASQPKRNSYGRIADDCMSVKVGDPCPCFNDYTDMAFSMGSETPKSSSPKEETSIGSGSLMDHMSDIGAFTVPKLSSNPNQGAKVIRADLQRRRRHCSETFLSVPTTVASLSLPYADHTKRHSSASFENVWTKGEHGAAAATEERPASISRQISTTFEHGLNYIDLDLVKDSNLEGSLQPARHFVLPLGNNCSAGLNLYASIDFLKSEELRNHKNHEDDTEC